jgi:hypothetical protein
MSKKTPILVFVVNEDYDWSPKKMDESLTKIKKFKAKAQANIHLNISLLRIT